MQERLKNKVQQKLWKKQVIDLNTHNKKGIQARIYKPSDVIFVRNNHRMGPTLTSRYNKETVRADLKEKIITQSERTVHKINIK